MIKSLDLLRAMDEQKFVTTVKDILAGLSMCTKAVEIMRLHKASRLYLTPSPFVTTRAGMHHLIGDDTVASAEMIF